MYISHESQSFHISCYSGIQDKIFYKTCKKEEIPNTIWLTNHKKESFDDNNSSLYPTSIIDKNQCRRRKKRKKKRENPDKYSQDETKEVYAPREGRSRLHFSTSKLLVRDPRGWHTRRIERKMEARWRLRPSMSSCPVRISIRLQSLLFSCHDSWQ